MITRDFTFRGGLRVTATQVYVQLDDAHNLTLPRSQVSFAAEPDDSGITMAVLRHGSGWELRLPLKPLVEEPSNS